MTVYDRLMEWQSLPGAYHDWKEYRKSLTDRICDLAEPEIGQLGVIGAGALNDLDLRRLSERFSEIRLIDRTTTSMLEGIRRQGLETDRFLLQETDILGVTDEDYREYCRTLQREVDRLGRDTDMTRLADIALVFLEDMYEAARKRRGTESLEKCELYVICGVHSQLNHMAYWIWQAYEQALGKRDERIGRRVIEETERLIPEFHEKLLAASKKQLLLAAETERLGVFGGIQGADQAIRDMKARAMRGEICIADETDFFWPFDLRQNIVYHMNLFNIRRTS